MPQNEQDVRVTPVDGVDRARSNVDSAYNDLKAAIVNNELPAGARLSQVQLAARFDMSRAPLREALRLLERDGLIETQHNRMVRVAGSSFADLDALYALRIVNEAFAVRLAVPTMTAEDIRWLHKSLDKLEEFATNLKWDSWYTEHRRFHLRLYEGAGERMLRIISEMFDHGQRYRLMYRAEEPRAGSVAAEEHAQIVDACAAGDGAKASELMARHLARTALTLFASAAPEHEPSLVREATRFVIQEPRNDSGAPTPNNAREGR